MSNPRTHNYTSKMYVGTSSTGPWTEIEDIKTIKTPKEDPSFADATDLSSAGMQEVQIASWQKATSFGATCFFHKTQYTTLRALRGLDRWWKITTQLLEGETNPSSTIVPGQLASCSKQDINRDDNPVMYEFQVAKTGEAIFTAGT